MPRNARVDVGGQFYHVINRANGRLQIFQTPDDYRLFETLLEEAVELFDIQLVAYTVMPNHWHLVVSTQNDGDLGQFMHRLSNSHTRKVHARTNTNGAGHLYQGRYKSFLVETDAYLLTLIRYVERNPVRALLVSVCEEWQWGSAHRRLNGSAMQKKLLAAPPLELPHDYQQWINTLEKEDDLASLRLSVNKSLPYGRESWVNAMIDRYKLQSTTRGQGRPRKN